MFHIQGPFELSLRSDELSPSGNKTLAALAKIHKHCTGKAHAHGCIDQKVHSLVKSDSNSSMNSRKSQRNGYLIEIKDANKNGSFNGNTNALFTKSFSNSTSSYEGHSDTDSENTSKNRHEMRHIDPCERLFTQNTKASLMKTARMRYADDSTIALLDEVDGEKYKLNLCRNPSRGSFKCRKSSEPVKVDDVNINNDNASDDKKKALTQHKVSVVRRNSGGYSTKCGNEIKPPWRGTSKNRVQTETLVRSPSLRGSIRKRTKCDGIPWRKLYEFSIWRRCGVSFASKEAYTDRALLRPWSELSSQPLFQAKSEEQLACEKEWLQAGHMWVAHRGGFAAVTREGDAGDGRVTANPPQLERAEDIASLRCLNECGALHVLRSRLAAGLCHARAGLALLVAAMFRGCRMDDMPPHVFAAAQSAHKCMLSSRKDRAIVFLGRSGSGKTSAMRQCVWYLATAYPAQGSKLTPEKLQAALEVLHLFGSSRTGSNAYASRFVSLTSLDFDSGGALVSASVQTLLPELKPDQSQLRALHIASEIQSCVFVVSANTGSGLKYQFASGACASRASRVLGVCVEELSRAVFAPSAPAAPPSPQQPPSLRTPSPSNERDLLGSECLDAFVTGLYNEVFNIVAAFERLQAVFHEAMLVAPRERYAQEGITLDDGTDEDWLSETVNPGPMVELLDKSPQNTIVRSSQADLRECDRRGLL
ncbi:unnamed protein product [Leptidea sinapis]|uniref:Myosin motor domain-containing protein n=1 Tax=Leptidea sinapis TaxID=189913 RepID=A0A5E4QCF9_9NEOP|nr:unnamed protein product [Leptidea sinapis]